ncbi:MAG: enoyl-CoA hydratase/isomerase family protein [Burkholderiales bacterium]|nr:enoyl-CoA hydratase/isomerase family protein [Burkholderiales bacterium]
MDIEVSARGAVTLIRINRPEAANALSLGARDALEAALAAFDGDASARIAVLTGAGDRHFCAGADLQGSPTPPSSTLLDRDDRPLLRDLGLSKPLIAALNGHALGGGLELALLADIRLAADHATLGLTEARLGSMPGSGGTQRLPRLVGLGHALLMALSGERIDAQEAMRWGLVSRVVPGAQLLDAALALAERIAANAPLSVRAIRHAMREGMEMPLGQGLALERVLFAAIRATEDRAEGRAAFREKRAPRFRGR